MMKNIEKAKNNGILSEMEAVLIQYLLEDGFYAEKYYSDVEVQDIADNTNFSIHQVKGLIGSLTKKEYVYTEMNNGFNIVYATDICYKLDDNYAEKWEE